MYAGWKSPGLHQFNELQTKVKEDQTTCDCMELELYYLIDQQTETSNKHQRITYRNMEYITVHNDLAYDLLDDVLPVKSNKLAYNIKLSV
jgi:hypothetical protein